MDCCELCVYHSRIQISNHHTTSMLTFKYQTNTRNVRPSKWPTRRRLRPPRTPPRGWFMAQRLYAHLCILPQFLRIRHDARACGSRWRVYHAKCCSHDREYQSTRSNAKSQSWSICVVRAYRGVFRGVVPRRVHARDGVEVVFCFHVGLYQISCGSRLDTDGTVHASGWWFSHCYGD